MAVALEPLAVLAGARTPFAKAFTALAQVPADQLGRIALLGALQKAGLTPADVGEVVFGNVGGQPDASNLGRVIALRAGVPYDRVAHTVNRNCASGMEAIIAAWHILCEGRAELVVAGGTESMSNIPFLWSRRAKDWFVQWGRAGWWGKLRLLTRWRPSFLRPIPALELGLTDPVCGLNMGQTAEILAKEFGISREEQDRFALLSHQRATEAWKRGFFQDEVVPVPAEVTGAQAVERDLGPRPQQTLEALAKLPPIFDRSGQGTVTAGNSCPITDGAAALVLMTVAQQRQRWPDRPVLGYIRGYALAGCEPRRMGLGPVFAIRKLLRTHGLRLSDFDLIEINEAFAAQVLACRRAMASPDFARQHWQEDQPLGELELEKLNVNGGAIALGHPVGTSGARLVLTLLRALRERGLRRGLAALCVGGGQGAAMWVETEQP
ncbi:thiolase family protein [Thermogemmata fonticola]|uniref:Thiolase family protein n=1 Tax=Thermogemmata fonticola TaxID=2755323 RepID=A0A7V9AD21_9BACT|nr:thiolase family protein [Thermogemmata fonticola]MBA2227573.1 thiolase family protein [Thermogemmata fonticola]